MRYSKIYALLLAAMVTAGSVSTAMAQSGSPTVHGNVYGGGNAADVGGDATVNMSGGQVGVSTVDNDHGNVFGGGKGQVTTVVGDVKVNIGMKVVVENSVTTTTYSDKGTVKGSVYGGSALGAVNGTKATDWDKDNLDRISVTSGKTTEVNIFAGTINGNVYGGGRGQTGDDAIAAKSFGVVTVKVGPQAEAGTLQVDGSVYGGSDANGVLESNVTVDVIRGTIGKSTTEGETTTITGGNVYGGGLGLPTLVQGSVTMNIGAADTTPTGTANILGDVYGGSAKGKVNATKGGTAENPTYSKTDSKTTQVNLYSNTGVRNVYGGGHGLDGASADVYGDVTVNIGATDGASTPTYTGNATINGSVFGCNNANGSPQGDVTVNVYKTAQTEKEAAAYTSSDATYAIEQVFGGGNEANYNPLETTNKAQVHIFTCLNTVKTVYGGGNAANGTNVGVTIDGGRFNRVFGGGNGEDSSKPAANISGSAITQVHGGRYDQVFGGSNSRGDVNSASLTLDNTSSCGDLVINNSFGGANAAEITGDVETTLICSSDPNSTFSIGSFYGGSNQADIKGNVTLNVYGGTYENVFGGSKGTSSKAANIVDNPNTTDVTEGNVTLNLYGGNITNAFGGSDVNGNITGKITVNVLDYQSNTCPLSITNIYGAGNLTTYTPDKVSDEVISSPEVNVIHMKEGSSITGNVYGGGKGDPGHNALVTANPIVNIGYDATTMSSLIPTDFLTTANLSSRDDLIATVSGNVYGGGDLAGVTGNTTVYLRKANTSVGGSLFGGGNEAVVSGNTSVNVVNGTVTQDVYGGGALANVGTNASNTTQVTVTNGTIRNIYGGGLGRLSASAVNYTQAEADEYNTAHNLQSGDEGFVTTETVKTPAVPAKPAYVNGAVTVAVNGGTVTEVFGCNNLNGAPQSTVEVNITNGNITNVFGGGNQAAYTGVPDVNISGGTITKVFGGGNEAGTGGSDVAIVDGTVTSGVYGGCNTSGTITGNTTVTLTGGTIGTSSVPAEVCGGGLGKDTKVTNSTTPCTSYVYVGTGTPGDATTYLGSTTLYGDIYGGSAYGEVDNTEVNLFKLANTSFGYNVFGGGKGKFVAAGDAGNIEAKVNGTAKVNMYALMIAGDDGDDDKAAVYGGCNVNGTATAAIVNLIGGTIGSSGTEANKVFGGGKGHQTTTNTATVNVGKATTTTGDNPTTTYSGTSYIYSNVYGGSALGAVGTANVNLYDAASLTGDVFGGGMGAGTSDNEDTRATITTMANVALYQLDISTKNIYGGCNVNGSAVATKVDLYGVKDGSTYYGMVNDVFGGGKGHSTSVTGSVNVNVGENTSTGDVTVMGEIYGGSEEGAVNNPIVNIYKAHSLGGSVFGGGKGIDDTATPANNVQATVTGTSKVFMYGNTLTYPIYGGCNANGSSENTEVTILGGTLGTSFTSLPASLDNILFGGGKGKLTSVTGTTKVYVGTKTTTGEGETATTTYDGDANIYGNVYGGSENGGVSAVNVYLYKDVIHGNVFGGGYDTKAQDTNPSATTVNVELDGTAFDCFYGTDENKTPQTGQIFGGNNENGWPTGLSTVHVYKTVAYGTTNVRTADKTNTTYELAAVYGGGNKAKSDANAGTSVIIEGCDATSIASVYGGGNAAYVMNSSVTVKGTYEIGTVFGGGNGTVSAADVKGTATTVLNGGTIHDFYGGSNSQGTIGKYEGGVASGGTDITINDLNLDTDCSLKVGNIYGAGKNANVDGNISMTMGCLSDAYTIQNLYGGAQAADIKGGVTLTVTSGRFDRVFGGNNLSGTIGGDITVNIEETGCKPIIIGQLFGGGNQAAFDHNTQVNVKSCTSIGQVFGGGLGSTAVVKGNTEVNINTTVSDLNKDATNGVFAESTFSFTDEDNNSVTVTIPAHAKDKVGTIGYVYGGGYGANVEGNSEVYIGTSQTDANATYGVNIINNVYGGGYGAATNVLKNVEVTIGAAANTYSPQIGGNVYGGSALGTVNGTELTDTYHTYVTLNKGNVTGTVFGGGQGKEPSSATATDGTEAKVYGNAVVTLYGDFVTGGLFGGCDKYGTMHGTAKLDLLGGTVGTPFTTEIPTTGLPEIVFGGGLGAYTTVVGDVTVNVGNGTSTGNCKIYGNVYGGSMSGTVAKVNVNLKEGAKIWGNVFGGGYRTAEGKTSATNVTVTLDGTTFDRTYDGTAQIFGANNVQGSPTGHVLVHVKNTAPVSGQTYDLAAVYGGGNNADYNPTDETQTAEVIIEGCNTTSIKNVYGGGNAAAVPGSEIWILGSKVIDNLFGGGNGEAGAAYAAHVGFHRTSATTKSNYSSGEGTTYVKLVGGTIHTVYGGSNSNGDIRGGANILMPTIDEFTASHSGMSAPDCCSTLTTTNIYGGGKNADMSGGTTVVLGCVEGLDNVYGGAMSANIKGGVNLVVTSGTFKKVFGGNDTKGTIQGPINLYIEETGCEPLVIGELYLGGNLAPYSVYGYKEITDPNDATKTIVVARSSLSDNEGAISIIGEPAADKKYSSTQWYADPQLNVTSFTSIGNVFGGGLGTSAVLYGNPTIEINEVVGRHADEVDGYPIDANQQDITALDGVAIPQHAKDAIGAIGNVYGGGNLATVYGSTKVNIGTETTVGFKTEPVHLRPSTAPTTPLTKNATTGLYDIPVDGVNITGNVYGGGNQADVTGDTQVNICAKETGTGDNKTWTSVTPGTAGVSIGENVFGGGKGIASDVTKAHVPATNIHIGNGAIKKSVYGGGELAQVEGNTNVTVMGGTIGTAKADLPSGVTMGAVYGNIYGGGMGNTTNSAAGLIKGNTNVTVANSIVGENTITPTILHNIYGGGAYGSVGDFTFTTGVPSAYNSGGTANVTITGGTIGTDGHENGMVFGSSRGDVAKPVAPSEGAAPVDPNDKLAWVYDANVIIGTSGATTGPQINGSVYGSGENGHTYNNAVVEIHGGKIGIDDTTVDGGAAYGYRGNVYGAGCGTDMYDSNADGTEDSYNPLAGVVYGTASVTMDGGYVVHNVYGAGAMGSVGKTNTDGSTSGGETTITIKGGRIGYDGNDNGNVYGAARGEVGVSTAASGLANVKESTVNINYPTTPTSDNTDKTAQLITGSVYGGGEAGTVKGDVKVEMIGGYVMHDVYGGGALADSNTSSSAETGAKMTKTEVNLYGGLIGGDAYGGGLGRLAKAAVGTEGEAGYQAPVTAVEAKVYGDVAVTLGTIETEAAPVTTATAFNISYYGDHADVVKSGRVFGCNNLNGSPQGDVKVTVNKTVAGNMTRTAAADLKNESATHQYEVAAVYGGGNLANYTANNKKLNVIINRCDVSVREVYGGGNAAAVPGTDVLVNGAYEIGTVFGGGNGKDDYWLNGQWNENQGANVNGNTNTLLLGGYIHEAYGGSNEKGTITGDISIDAGDDKDRPAACEGCPLEVGKIVGAGKNADVKGTIKMIMGCKPETKIPLVYGGADNANVDGNVELTITSGHFGKVFGGNNEGGIIMGYIKLNIEETGECATPITIDELYLGGNQAAYSKYGYYVEKNADGTPKLTPDGKLSIKPRESAMDAHKAIKSIDGNEFVEYTDEEHFTSYSRHPELNVISCTKIGTVFGGGYGEKAVMYANPTVNINMIPGSHAKKIDRDGNGTADNNAHALGEIGTVYGGGNAAAVHGNTMVNIGTATSVTVNSWEYDPETKEYTAHDRTVEGAYVTGNIYGGGNLADVTGNTNVNICAKYDEEKAKYMPVVEGESKVVIAGDVYGGGKGKEDTFTCEKAMVGIVNEGIGSTSVNIGNGTVAGNVFGGGEVGRVEHDTEVTVGLDEGTSTPVVKGSVFGAGSGLDTHGYSALVRGSSTVIVQGNAKVQQSVYGGGEKASVGRYYIATTQALADQYKVEIGEPYDLMSGGKCTVIIQGNAEIGPDGMQMTAAGGPDDAGHVFGAGKGVLPYEGYDSTNKPWRMYRDDSGVDQKEYYDASNEADYFKYIKTLALNNDTEVTIAGNAFVKGSVYGGSENGRVRQDTKVKILGGQIGAGEGMTEAYKETDWAGSTTPAGGWKECAHWTYDTTDPDGGKPYDKYAGTEGYDAKGGAKTATDGHTFYGNVFGGGSGYYPYAPGKWYDAAGQVYGNTLVEITGGHILTSVYGGCEVTDVKRNCTITMSGGTIGVPQTDEERQIHPVIGNIFGAGKGDKRILFNTWTNVDSTKVNVSGGTVYGNVYGGGEDGHVLGLAATTISGSETGTIIGITGTSGYDGNVFGGGRGSASALTAGVVGGNVKLNIQGGLMKGSVYGGGRLASVGTFFALASAANYGRMQDGDDHGNIVVNLTGGTIKQNVFGGCMGSTTDNRLGVSKNVTVNLNGYETTTGETTTTVIVADDKKGCVVKGSVFGCNNLESSPLGDVLVHVYGTQKDGASQIANTAGSGETAAVENAKTPATQVAGEFDLSSFDVKAVYGGGNLAAYKPQGPGANTETYDYKNTTKFAKVIIDGCGRTSIGHVYGGGNAASTPATEVTVNGTYEIGELFGGGNGKDDVTIDGVTKPNPGANVGYYNYSIYEKDGDTWKVKDDPNYDTKEKRLNSAIQYGTGKAAVNIFGGTIHRVFGGSNTKGNVRQSAITLLEDAGGCDFCVDEAYGGGKSAPMDAEAKLLMACIPGLKAVYGGAQAADVYDDVTLTITNGNFDRVFGGNNISGTIRGRIQVNIEETGCKPVIIGELYGGGNQAGYSVYGYNADGSLITSGETPLYADPEVNVKSFTSIGNIYGGGYGTTATMVGNPTVNINEDEDATTDAQKHATAEYAEKTITLEANTENEHQVTLPKHTKGKMGAINNVFGGGNAAKVIGNTNVNIGTQTEGYMTISDTDITVGTTDVSNFYTRTGTTTANYVYTQATGTAQDGVTYYKQYTVIGADIRGNVYGGGNNAEVTGNTNVTIGQEKKTE